MKKIVGRKISGFSLIEILVVISIIGLLSTIVMSSITGARIKANRVSFQTTTKSVQSSLLMCCESVNTTLMVAADTSPLPGDSICRKASDYSDITSYGDFPSASSIGSIVVDDDCDGGTFSVVLTPGIDNTGGWETATCNNNECIYAN